MSLGYVKGKYWVADEHYRSFTQWDCYQSLIAACRAAGVSFNCEFSYTAKRYMAETITLERIGGSFYETKHNNNFHDHPMLALTGALRGYPHGSPLISVLCVEIDIRVLAQKLLPLSRLEQAVEDLIYEIRGRA